MSVAILFAGQGTQFAGMGERLYKEYRSVREIFEEASQLLGYDIRKVCFEGEGLETTLKCQPALFCLCLSIYNVLKEKWELSPSFFCGHSLGEYIAVAAAGADFSKMLLLVKRRAELMHKACKKVEGGMMAVLGPPYKEVAEVVENVEEVWVSNINCPGQTVLSGKRVALEKVKKLLGGNARCIMLNVEGPFHTPFMQEVKEALSEHTKDLCFEELKVSFVANFDARAWRSNISVPLLEQITSCVQWQRCIEYMMEEGVDSFLEIAPRPLLSKIVKRINGDARCVSICGIEEMESGEWRKLCS
jgi:[acyl-carrier-protein] S-malonyltransferase